MESDQPRTPDTEDGARCLCGRDSTEGSIENEDLALQIECDICHVWYHARCVSLGPMGANAIDKYHCPRCETMCGPSLMKLRTNSHRHDCTDPDARNKPTQVGTQDFIEELHRRTFPDALANNLVNEVSGTQVTLPYLNQTGFRNPVLVHDSEDLGLCMPDLDFSVEDVPHAVGPNIQIDVIDVHTQDTRLMKLTEFVSHFRIPLEDRASSDVLNCLSLEVSDTALGDQVDPPAVARKLCWVNNVWPQPSESAWDSIKRPQVQKYCIMSMKDSFTDFHIDFGGTSVWYHIFKGEKIFYFIQPTSNNLSLYERWQRLSSQSETFLGDMVDRCYRLQVQQGQTVLIPTGWIHAVYTPRDSLVFGGNFLHSLNIQLQLRVFEIEDRIRTPNKFRFPSFEAVNWLAAQKLKNDLSDLNSDSTLCPSHLLGGIKALSQTLRSWLHNLDARPCPDSINPHQLVRELAKEVRTAERISAKCNPPTPQRESKRKKQKKELNEDFVDISHVSAFLLLGGRSTPKKKPAAKFSKDKLNEIRPEFIEPVSDDISPDPYSFVEKKPLKKRASKFLSEEESNTITLKLPKRQLDDFTSAQQPPAATSAFDLTDQDSVRQLMGSGSRQTMRQLNSALDDALAGFSDEDNNEDDSDLVIDDTPPVKKALKVKLNVGPKKMKPLKSRELSRSTVEDFKMTKAHQDDDYIYPSLELSDDELEIGPSNNQPKDETWNPKVRVKNVAGKSEPRPTRAKKVTAVEMGLKLASERRKTKIVSKKKFTTPKKPTPQSEATAVLSKTPLMSTSKLGLTPLSKQLSASKFAASVSSSQRKKGMLTAKQRIAKTLGLKF